MMEDKFSSECKFRGEPYKVSRYQKYSPPLIVLIRYDRSRTLAKVEFVKGILDKKLKKATLIRHHFKQRTKKSPNILANIVIKGTCEVTNRTYHFFNFYLDASFSRVRENNRRFEKVTS